ncbi:hypothetical protein F2P81_021530 [Scophthalmus maximus]|uniref:Uncharacterized protein n=1 Tax=Scophthalmus maximus TaxID=52904 RepID=A0A6A4RXL9_SCOMX|nr:hypothetical protein F2P81_021530 [Scophthalmus maximus]
MSFLNLLFFCTRGAIHINILHKNIRKLRSKGVGKRMDRRVTGTTFRQTSDLCCAVWALTQSCGPEKDSNTIDIERLVF